MSLKTLYRIILVLSLSFMVFIAPKTSPLIQAALVFLTFGIGDLASTKHFLSRGGEEWNPFARYILKHSSFSALVIAKLLGTIYLLIVVPLKAWPLIAILGIMATLQNYWSTHDSGYTSLKVK